jgi:hypothetical protein
VTGSLLAQSRPSEGPSTWTAPKLPASVIASIWTDRFMGSSTAPPTGMQQLRSSYIRLILNFRPEPPYIVAAAFLSLLDAGLIRIAVAPGGRMVGSLTRVWVERTDLALPNFELPAVEAGLLIACNDLTHQRFRRTTQPSAFSVIKKWKNWKGANYHPYRWVLGVAIRQGIELGLYEPVIKKQGGARRRFDEKPAYSIEHLAACEEQVVACVARWQNFGVNEPELQDRLLTEVTFALDNPTSG